MTHFGTEQGLTSLHVAALLEDRHTNLWAGTYAGLFRRVGERFEPVPGPPALREPILALLEDRAGELVDGGARRTGSAERGGRKTVWRGTRAVRGSRSRAGGRP